MAGRVTWMPPLGKPVTGEGAQAPSLPVIRDWVGGRPFIREVLIDGKGAQLVSSDEGDGPRMLNPQATRLWWKEMARRTGVEDDGVKIEPIIGPAILLEGDALWT